MHGLKQETELFAHLHGNNFKQFIEFLYSKLTKLEKDKDFKQVRDKCQAISNLQKLDYI